MQDSRRLWQLDSGETLNDDHDDDVDVENDDDDDDDDEDYYNNDP